MSARRIITALAALALIAGSAVAEKKNTTTAGTADECYNSAARICAQRHPGQDMGDSAYAACINEVLDFCDTKFPAMSRPAAGGVLATPGSVYQPPTPPRPIISAPVVKKPWATKSAR